MSPPSDTGHGRYRRAATGTRALLHRCRAPEGPIAAGQGREACLCHNRRACLRVPSAQTSPQFRKRRSSKRTRSLAPVAHPGLPDHEGAGSRRDERGLQATRRPRARPTRFQEVAVGVGWARREGDFRQPVRKTGGSTTEQGPSKDSVTARSRCLPTAAVIGDGSSPHRATMPERPPRKLPFGPPVDDEMPCQRTTGQPF